MTDRDVTIGVCEDDDELRSIVVTALRRSGFDVRPTATGADAIRAFTDRPPAALILDVGLPDADGRDVCQALRARGVVTPVLFLTARDALTDRLSGFHAGGDDYLTKPFALPELIVRVQALVRRQAPAVVPEVEVEADALRFDPASHAVRRGDQVVPLTPTEFRLLAALAARPGEVVRRASLIAAAWPDGAIVHNNTLDAYMTRIRRKLSTVEADRRLRTARGVGYSLE